MKNSILGAVVAVLASAALIGFGVTQEVPVGQVQGKVRMKENGRSLPNALVSLNSVVHTDWNRGKPMSVESRPDGSFVLRRVPTGDYLLSVSSENHQLEKRTVHIDEGTRLELDIEAEPAEFHLTARAAQNVFMPDEVPHLTVKGFALETSLAVNVWKLKPDSIANSGGAQPALEPIVSRWGEKRGSLNDVATKLVSFEHAIAKRDVEGAFIEPIDLKLLPQGVYYIESKAGSTTTGAVIYVSSIALITKSNAKEVRCFVTNIKTGTPIARAEILRVSDKQLVKAGVTDASGMATVESGVNRDVVIARVGDALALSRFYGDREHGDESKPGKNVIYTARPIYKPGDRVQFKGIVRTLVGNDFKLPNPGDAKITVLDPDQNVISEQTAKLSPHGTYTGSFATSREAKPGGYEIECVADGVKGSFYASVAAYRKPEFDVRVKSTQHHFVLGEEATAEVTCKYYFGGPVAGAKIQAYVTRNPVWAGVDSDEDADPDERVSDSTGGGAGGQFSQNVEATTDAHGKAIIKFPTRVDHDPDQFAQDYTYTVAVNSTESNSGPGFSATGDVRVTRGDVDVQASPSSYVSGLGKPITIDVQTRLQSEGHAPAPNRPVLIRFGREKWKDEVSTFNEISTVQATTGADGKVSVSVPSSVTGSFTAKVETRDGAGRTVTAECWVWSESGFEAGSSEPKFEIKLDKKQYREGDTAIALITTDAPGGAALITAEADSILYSKTVPLSGTTTRIEIPVSHDMSPNCFVSAAYVRNKQYSESSHRLLIDRGSKKLNVDVKVDQKQLLPGEKCAVEVTTTDEAGKPVDAELSVAVVDESIYAIKEDKTDLIADFYPRRGNRVSTSYSFPEIHLDGGDKGGGNVPVRSRFLDTAYWNAQMVTKGGKGTCVLQVPDNLTSWRVTAVGVTDQTAVGLGKSSVVVKKPVMVRMTTPRFMVRGDQVDSNLMIHNDSGRSQHIHLSVEAFGLVRTSNLPTELDVADGEVRKLTLSLRAGLSGDAKLVAKAWTDSGGPSDGVEQHVAVQPHGRRWIEGNSGSIDGQATLTFNLRASADPETGGLRVSVAPTLATSLVRSLDSLVDYPYGCVEQTMSRFLPAILVQKLLRESGISRPDLDAKIPAIASDGFARLAKMQHEDGGWGWWEHDKSDIYMTSLVLDGLSRAKEAGFETTIKVARAKDWLANQVKEPMSSKLKEWEKLTVMRARAYAAYALTTAGGDEPALTLARRFDLSKTNAEQTAMIALAAKRANASDLTATALARLAALAQRDGDNVAWKGGEWGSEIEAQAMVLAALEVVAPTSGLIAPAARTLMRMRKGEAWETTRQTAYAIIALTKYLSETRELIGQKSVDVVVNGKKAFTKTWRTGEFELGSIDIPMNQLKPGPNEIKFVGTGSTAYFTSEVTQYDVQDQIGQMLSSSDISVTRSYRRFEVRSLEDGSQKLVPSDQPVTQVNVGDILQCEIKIKAPNNREYVMIEDPNPSNCSVVEREEIDEYAQWSYLWSGIQVMDNRVGFFISRLSPGTTIIRYTLRAESVGKSRALPTRVEEMYRPSNWTSGAENALQVLP